MAAYTMQNAVDRARVFLNDANATDANRRNPDAQLLQFANEWILIARRDRPDLFIGSYTTLPQELALTDPFPTSSEFLLPCVDFIVARAEMEDDEYAVDSRAVLMEKLFEAGM